MRKIPDSTQPTQQLLAIVQQLIGDAVRDAVADALCEMQPSEPSPVLVDRSGLAHALSCSLSTIDRLRSEGCPQVLVGDSPRFRVAAVVQWLEARAAGGPTHAIQGGKG